MFSKLLKSSYLYWFIFGAVVLIAGGTIWWSWSENLKINNTEMEPVEIIEPNLCGPEPPAVCAKGARLTCENGKWECGEKKENPDVSNWKIYRNEKYEYQFEFKYPKNWSDITTNYDKEQERYTFSNMLGLGESGGVDFTINVRNDKNDVDLFNILKKLRPGEKFEKNLIIYEKISDITVGGFPAMKYFADRTVIPAELLPIGNEIILKIDNITFNFSPVGTENALQKNEFIFNQILSTFNVIFIE